MNKIALIITAAILAGCGNYNERRYKVPCEIPPTAFHILSDTNMQNDCAAVSADPGDTNVNGKDSRKNGCYTARPKSADVSVGPLGFWDVMRHEFTHLLDTYCLNPGQSPEEDTEGAGQSFKQVEKLGITPDAGQ